MQYHHAEDSWALKDPFHFRCLGWLNRTYLDFRLVVMRRQPREVVSSLCSLVSRGMEMGFGTVDREKVGPPLLKSMAEVRRRGEQNLAQLHASRAHVVDYDGFLADPMGTVEKIYDHFGVPQSEAAWERMADWIEKNPIHKHGRHQHDLESYGLKGEDVDRCFATK